MAFIMMKDIGRWWASATRSIWARSSAGMRSETVESLAMAYVLHGAILASLIADAR
jgi:hypothetical protein